MPDPWTRSQLEEALGVTGARALWACTDEVGPVGFVVARRIADLLEIDLVGVDPEHRRSGIAHELLKVLLEREEGAGMVEARLELAASNAPAGALYEKLGFVVVGRRARYYPDGGDALLLTRHAPSHPGATRASDQRETSEKGGRSKVAAQETGVQSPHAAIRGRARVLANRIEGNGRILTLAVPDWPGSIPGQFLMIGAGAESEVARRDPLLPRPMAVYRELGAIENAHSDSAEPAIELLYRVVGRGTTLLSEAEPGESISLVGPLGRGFPIEAETADAGPAILVGGGTGIASLYELAKALAAAGREVLVILGARSTPDLTGRDDFEALGVELICTTEDGSMGIKGRVTIPLAVRLEAAKGRATVFAVGPTPMMRACADLASEHASACFVSLENPMACGFGVCLGCAAPRAEGGFSLVCKAGPVFDAQEIDWEGLP